MKSIKKIMSLALALVMIVGALVVIPTEVKAAPIGTLTSTADANAETGKFGFKLSDYCSDYVDGADYKITVVLGSDGAAGSFGGGVGAATQLEGGWAQAEWTGNGASTTVVFNGTKLHEDRAEIQVWWLGEGNSVTIESITVEKVVSGSDDNDDENEGIHTFTAAGAENGFTINPAEFCEGYTDGKDYVITVKLSSTGVAKGVVGCCSKPDYSVWNMTDELECNGTATWTLEVVEMYGSPKVELWWLADGATVTIDEITIVEKVAENPNPNPNPGTPEGGEDNNNNDNDNDNDNIEATGDFSMVLPLVLVLFGGVAVIVASKKRFA